MKAKPENEYEDPRYKELEELIENTKNGHSILKLKN